VNFYRLILVALLCVFASCGGTGESDILGAPAGPIPTAPTTPTGTPTEPPIAIGFANAFPNLTFRTPTLVTHAGDGSNRLFVAQLDGTIRVFDNDPGASTSELFLDISSQVVGGDGRGLLGLAFDPNYASSRYFYVYYSASTATPGQTHRSVISRFQTSLLNPNAADPASEIELLSFDQPAPLHDGGCLVFGNDGMLYISSGDGGEQGDPMANAQNLTSLLGKILRLTASGAVPADNPFVGQGGGVRPEIWAYGLRNPWRMSFDRVTGELWVGDVGQDRVEEIDLVTRGGNYGWPLFEGTLPFDNPGGVPLSATISPIASYTHAVGKSITGGLVYRGNRNLTLAGSYIYGDFVSGRIWALRWSGQQVLDNREIAIVPRPVAFGEDQAGELLICSFNGTLYRLFEMR
jgi:glucose/arabinose dehydrogenase